MVQRRTLQNAAERLSAVGEAGASFLGLDPAVARVLDEQQRRMKTLEQTVRLLINHALLGPMWGEPVEGDPRPGRVQSVPDGVDTYTFWLKSTEADSSGIMTIRHNKGIMLDNYLILKTVARPGDPLALGTFKLEGATTMQTTFRYDQQGRGEDVAALVALMPSQFVEAPDG